MNPTDLDPAVAPDQVVHSHLTSQLTESQRKD
jgi:hypothetical protein